MKAGPGEACHEASARCLDRSALPGPVHGFTLSTSGRESLQFDDDRCGHSSPLPRWAQLCTGRSPSWECGGHFFDASQDPVTNSVHQVGTGGDVEARRFQQRFLTRHPEPRADTFLVA